jgi:hypothetical protein
MKDETSTSLINDSDPFSSDHKISRFFASSAERNRSINNHSVASSSNNSTPHSKLKPLLLPQKAAIFTVNDYTSAQIVQEKELKKYLKANGVNLELLKPQELKVFYDNNEKLRQLLASLFGNHPRTLFLTGGQSDNCILTAYCDAILDAVFFSGYALHMIIIKSAISGRFGEPIEKKYTDIIKALLINSLVFRNGRLIKKFKPEANKGFSLTVSFYDKVSDFAVEDSAKANAGIAVKLAQVVFALKNNLKKIGIEEADLECFLHLLSSKGTSLEVSCMFLRFLSLPLIVNIINSFGLSYRFTFRQLDGLIGWLFTNSRVRSMPNYHEFLLTFLRDVFSGRQKITTLSELEKFYGQSLERYSEFLPGIDLAGTPLKNAVSSSVTTEIQVSEKMPEIINFYINQLKIHTGTLAANEIWRHLYGLWLRYHLSSASKHSSTYTLFPLLFDEIEKNIPDFKPRASQWREQLYSQFVAKPLFASSPLEGKSSQEKTSQKFVPEIIFQAEMLWIVKGALRLFVIGDIHADANILLEELKAAGLIKKKNLAGNDANVDDILKTPEKHITIRRGDVVVFDGDVIDSHLKMEINEVNINAGQAKIAEALARQTPNLDTLALIRELKNLAEQKGALVLAVLGNHECIARRLIEVMDEKLSVGEDTSREDALRYTLELAGGFNFHQHYQLATVFSVEEIFGEHTSYDELLKSERSWIIEFIKQLPLVIIVDNAVITHAKIPDLDLEKLNINSFSDLNEAIKAGFSLKDWPYASQWCNESREQFYREEFYKLIRRLQDLPCGQNMYTFVAHDPSSGLRRGMGSNSDIFFTDGGATYHYRKDGGTPGAVCLTAQGRIDIYAKEEDIWQQMDVRFADAPSEVLSSQNAQELRKLKGVDLEEAVVDYRGSNFSAPGLKGLKSYRFALMEKIEIVLNKYPTIPQIQEFFREQKEAFARKDTVFLFFEEICPCAIEIISRRRMRTCQQKRKEITQDLPLELAQNSAVKQLALNNAVTEEEVLRQLLLAGLPVTEPGVIGKSAILVLTLLQVLKNSSLQWIGLRIKKEPGTNIWHTASDGELLKDLHMQFLPLDYIGRRILSKKSGISSSPLDSSSIDFKTPSLDPVGTFTYFGRDGPTIDYMAQLAINKLNKGEILEVLSFGSSYGQQGYDLAMSIAERRRQTKTQFHTNLIISDIDPQLVAYAQKGVYPAQSIRSHPRIIEVAGRGEDITSFDQQTIDERCRRFFRNCPEDPGSLRTLSQQEWLNEHDINIEFKVMDITDEGAYITEGKKYNIILARNVHYEPILDRETPRHAAVFGSLSALAKKTDLSVLLIQSRVCLPTAYLSVTRFLGE